jgi:hypothetical protein
MADAASTKVIVARLIDDKPMPVREKGPLFVVYPFDSSRRAAFVDLLRALDLAAQGPGRPMNLFPAEPGPLARRQWALASGRCCWRSP